jgi:hypothetical protein
MEGDIYIVQKQLDQDLPCTLYSKPNSDLVTGFCKNDTLYDVHDFRTGFVLPHLMVP